MSLSFKNLVDWLKGEMKRTPVPSPIRLDRPLDGAVHDAEVLLAFSVQSRRSLKGELVTKMSQACETLRAADEARRPATAAERTDFWQAYDELAVAMAPLSAHSIRSSVWINTKRFPASIFTPPAMLALVTIAVFIFCMIVQSFWVAGKSLLDAADAVEVQRVELGKKYALSLQAASSAELKYAQLLDQVRERAHIPGGSLGVPQGRSPTSADLSDAAKVDAQARILRTDFVEKRLITEQLSSELVEANRSGRPLQELLGQWHYRARSICDQTIRFLCPVDSSSNATKVDGAHRPNSVAKIALQSAERIAKGEREENSDPRLQASVSSETGMQSKTLHEVSVEADGQRKASREVRIILENLATYIIPAAMGLLGSLAFLLQSMANQLREHTYTPISVSASIMRFCLGAIAGVFGGLAGPGSDAVLKGLPPLFVPFVFGYGIEILFSLLDRVVQTFTQTERAKSRPL